MHAHGCLRTSVCTCVWFDGWVWVGGCLWCMHVCVCVYIYIYIKGIYQMLVSKGSSKKCICQKNEKRKMYRCQYRTDIRLEGVHACIINALGHSGFACMSPCWLFSVCLLQVRKRPYTFVHKLSILFLLPSPPPPPSHTLSLPAIQRHAKVNYELTLSHENGTGRF